VLVPLASRFAHTLEQSHIVQTVGFFHPWFPQILNVIR
jgi:hypothetical protein